MKCKGRALIQFSLYVDGSAVRGDDGFHKTEAEAEAGGGAALLAAIKPIPYSRQFVGSDSNSLIAQAE